MKLPQILFALFVATIELFAALPAAEPAWIEGRWIAFDGDTGRKRAVIDIVRVDRRATGRIVELFLEPGENPDPVCENCPGDARGRRIYGLAILDVQAEDDGASYRGTVLDPEDGASYRCVVTILPGGTRLRLRGFVGLEIFGHDKIWARPD